MAATNVLFMDQLSLINATYKNCLDYRTCTKSNCENEHTCRSYSFNSVFFDILSPFVMDSQALAMNLDQNTVNKTKLNRNRKRKYKQMSHYDDNPQDLKMENALKTLLSSLKSGEKSYFTAPTKLDIVLNNAVARAAAKLFYSKVNDLFDSTNGMPKSTAKITSKFPHVTNDVINCLVEHDGQNSCVVKLNDRDYLIPPNCSFLLSTVDNLKILVANEKKYDVILMDPPWENKSIIRKKSYPTLSEETILSLPIQKLLNTKKCLVLVWTTNNQKLINFVKDSLFKHWKIKYVTEWFWLKITKSGLPVVPLKCSHKKPYERLIVGGINCDKSILKEQILVSVPSSISSHKPHIKDVLLQQKLISSSDKCLEIFGRSLNECWTTVGNDVLAMQRLDNYISLS